VPERRMSEQVLFRMLSATSAIVVLSFMSTTRAQERVVVVVGANIPVTRGWESRPLIEPHLIADSRDPRHLLGTMMVTTASADRTLEQPCVTVLSVDGGLTWTQTSIGLVECGDPWLSMTPDGQAVLTVLGKTSHSANAGLHLLAYSFGHGYAGRSAADFGVLRERIVLGGGFDARSVSRSAVSRL